MASLDFGFQDFSIPDFPSAPAVDSWPEIPSYNLVPSSNFEGINLQSAITAPDTSGVFGGISDWFGSASSSVSSGASGVVSSIGNWFATPSNSNQSNVQKTAGVISGGSSIAGTVSSWFKSTSAAPAKNNATAASGQTQQGLGVLGALKALVGVGPAPKGSTTMTQAIGGGVSNILSPFKSTLFLMLLVLIAGWLILGRVQRMGGG